MRKAMVGASLLLALGVLVLGLVPRDRPAAVRQPVSGAATVLVEDAWVRSAPRAGASSAAYARISNTGREADRLLSAWSDIAARVELHTHIMDGGIARMRQVDTIELPAGRSVDLRPGGLHVMFLDLLRPLAAGETVVVRLVFEKAGEIRLELPVAAATALPTQRH